MTLFASAMCCLLLTQCGTVQNDVLIAYPDRPLLPLEQCAVIAWGVKGEHDAFHKKTSQMMLQKVNGADAVNVGTWNGYKRIAVKPGPVAVEGWVSQGQDVRATVRLQAGHEYEFLGAPYVVVDGREMTPEEAAAHASAAVTAAVPALARAPEVTQQNLKALFYLPGMQLSSPHQALIDVISRYKRRGLMVVRDRSTGALSTAEDAESQRLFAKFRSHIPALLKTIDQPVIQRGPMSI